MSAPLILKFHNDVPCFGSFFIQYARHSVGPFNLETYLEVSWNCLDQRMRTLFYKEPDNKYFRFCGLHSLSQLLNSAVSIQKQPWTYTNKWAWLYFHMTLFSKTGGVWGG